MFEFAWPWIFLLAPLPWLLRALLPAADSGEAALKVSFLNELEGLSGQRARANLPAWRQQAPFVLLWMFLVLAAARPEWVGEPLPLPTSGRFQCSSPVPGEATADGQKSTCGDRRVPRS